MLLLLEDRLIACCVRQTSRAKSGDEFRVHYEVRRTITSVEDDVTFGEFEVGKWSYTPDFE